MRIIIKIVMIDNISDHSTVITLSIKSQTFKHRYDSRRQIKISYLRETLYSAIRNMVLSFLISRYLADKPVHTPQQKRPRTFTEMTTK